MSLLMDITLIILKIFASGYQIQVYDTHHEDSTEECCSFTKIKAEAFGSDDLKKAARNFKPFDSIYRAGDMLNYLITRSNSVYFFCISLRANERPNFAFCDNYSRNTTGELKTKPIETKFPLLLISGAMDKSQDSFFYISELRNFREFLDEEIKTDRRLEKMKYERSFESCFIKYLFKTEEYVFKELVEKGLNVLPLSDGFKPDVDGDVDMSECWHQVFKDEKDLKRSRKNGDMASDMLCIVEGLKSKNEIRVEERILDASFNRPRSVEYDRSKIVELLQYHKSFYYTLIPGEFDAKMLMSLIGDIKYRSDGDFGRKALDFILKNVDDIGEIKTFKVWNNE
jgi:hypothetical protein